MLAGAPSTVLVACGTPRGPVLVYPASIQPGALQGVPDPSSTLAAAAAAATPGATTAGWALPLPLAAPISWPQQPEPLALLQQPDAGAANRTPTALAWLPGAAALAVASGDDFTVQIWAGVTAADRADAAAEKGAAARPPPPQAWALVAPASPALLGAVKGHTDVIAGLVARSCYADHPAARQLAWLFTAGRDQSVRAHAVDLAALWRAFCAARQQQLLQQQREKEMAAAARQAAAAAAAAKAEQGGEGAVEGDTATAAAVEGALPGAEGGAEEGEGGAAPEGGEGAAAGDGAAAEAGEGAGGVAVAAAAGKTVLAGVPGGRPKGSKKAPAVGAKPIIDPSGQASGFACLPMRPCCARCARLPHHVTL